MYASINPDLLSDGAMVSGWYSTMVRRSDRDRARVIGLSAEGKSVLEIIRATGFTKDFVRRWSGRDGTTDQERAGRPVKLTPPVARTVVAMMKGKKGRSTRRVAKLLSERKNIHLSHMTVRTAAKRAGLSSYKRQQKPLLSDDHKARRRQFARKYRNQNWQLVLFTDEKTFELFGHPKNDFVWHESAAAVPPSPKVKHPPKLHVWAGMSYYGKTELVIFEGNMTADFYVEEILSHRLPADGPRIFGNRVWTFQQDGDPKHTSDKAQKWLAQNVPRFINKGDWPANSPDQNPMENLWGIVQDRVYAREPRTVVALERIIREEWENIPLETLQSLAESMPRRLAALVANNGGSTKY
jgi:transposase